MVNLITRMVGTEVVWRQCRVILFMEISLEIA